MSKDIVTLRLYLDRDICVHRYIAEKLVKSLVLHFFLENIGNYLSWFLFPVKMTFFKKVGKYLDNFLKVLTYLSSICIYNGLS